VWSGLAVSAAWYGVFLLYTALLGDGVGRFDALGPGAWASELVWCLLIGLPPAVTAYTLRGAAHDLDDLAPALRAGPTEIRDLQREITRAPRGWVRVAGVVGLVFAFVAVRFQPMIWVADRLPPPTDPAFLWLLGRNMLNSWFLARAVMLEVLLARAFSRVGDRLPAVDLLDRAQLAPFGRRGLRSVLLWMLLLSLFAPLYVLGAAEPLLVVALVFLVSFAATAFLLPVRGAHRRIAAAKEHELTRVRAALHEARSRVLAAPSDAVQGGRLADLVAWEQRVAAAREWPFGAPTVWRFALYTGIGLASWIGAALVERALETALR